MTLKNVRFCEQSDSKQSDSGVPLLLTINCLWCWANFDHSFAIVGTFAALSQTVFSYSLQASFARLAKKPTIHVSELVLLDSGMHKDSLRVLQGVFWRASNVFCTHKCVCRLESVDWSKMSAIDRESLHPPKTIHENSSPVKSYKIRISVAQN